MNTDFEAMNSIDYEKLVLETEQKKKKHEYNRRYYKKHIHDKARPKVIK